MCFGDLIKIGVHAYKVLLFMYLQKYYDLIGYVL